jgi:quercetin dioxygenase-like cupin family protein
MPEAPRVIHLEELEAIPGPGSLIWRPVRLTLGLRAFGCNAYTATEAGQDVVEPHTEDPKLAHQELYFVASGRARFTVDGESYEAPAGTYVFIPDPASHRHAVAEEVGTTVLSFGGPPTFEPSAWEWAFRAAPLFRSEPQRAREILEDGLAVHPDSANLHYNVARLEAVQGKADAALVALRKALGARPEMAEWAREDGDLAGLREDPDFRALVGLPSA